MGPSNAWRLAKVAAALLLLGVGVLMLGGCAPLERLGDECGCSGLALALLLVLAAVR